MKLQILAGAFLVAAAAAQAASCGSFGTPSACTITVGGNILYTFSAFNLTNSTGSQIYAPSEIGIDVSTGGGNSALLTFSKLNAATGVVFSANPGESKNFSLQYNVAVSAIGPGTAAFAAPSVVSLGLSSAIGNGFSAVQMILSGSPGVSCQALRNVSGVSDGTCASLPGGGLPGSMQVGDSFTLFGGTGNTSMNNISNLFNATFTPAPPTGGVPEPSTWAMVCLGAAILAGRRRFRRRPSQSL